MYISWSIYQFISFQTSFLLIPCLIFQLEFLMDISYQINIKMRSWQGKLIKFYNNSFSLFILMRWWLSLKHGYKHLNFVMWSFYVIILKFIIFFDCFLIVRLFHFRSVWWDFNHPPYIILAVVLFKTKSIANSTKDSFSFIWKA